MAYLFLGRTDEAVTTLVPAWNKTPKQTGVRLHMACAYVEAGRIDDANAEIKALVEVSPDYTVLLTDNIFRYRLDDFRVRFAKNLRTAGLPES